MEKNGVQNDLDYKVLNHELETVIGYVIMKYSSVVSVLLRDTIKTMQSERNKKK